MTQVEIRLEHIPNPLLEDFELGESTFSLMVQVSRDSSSHNLLPVGVQFAHLAIPEEMPILRRA
jgi:hypothetical protein